MANIISKMDNQEQFSLYKDENGIDFYVSESYGIEDIKKCQKKSVEMLKVVVDIFERHNIAYVLAHGTLLGLIRHNGFIPWDDDCDLFVFDWDYARAIELLRRELPSDMITHNRRTDPIYWPKWTKVRDLNSDTYESLWKIDRKFKYHGICVDILKVTMVNKNEYLYSDSVKNLEKRIKSRSSKFSKMTPSQMLFAFPKYFAATSRDKLKLKKIEKKIKNSKEQICVGNKDTIIECSFEYNDVFPTRKLVFEGVEVAVPKNPENVLTSMYGDFMKMPEIEDRKPHFERVIFFDKKQK